MRDKLKFLFLLLILLCLFSFLVLLRFDQASSIKNWFSSNVVVKIENIFENVGLFKTFVSKYSLNEQKRIGIGAGIENDNPKTFEKLLAYEDLIQHKLTYELIFISWGDTDNKFPKEFVKGWKDLEITPILTWEPWKKDFVHPETVQEEYTFDSIINGEHDDYIRQWAKDSKEAKVPIVIRFAQEQSTPIGSRIWYPWQGDPIKYVITTRYIHDIFVQEGATNVKFMWSPYSSWGKDAMQYYPGDRYIDYVGYTVINHGSDTPKDPKWISCQKQFGTQYENIDLPNKDIIIVEFGTSENGGDKSEWVSNCLNIFQSIPKIIGVVSLEHARDDKTVTDWRINTSQKSLDSFKGDILMGNFK